MVLSSLKLNNILFIFIMCCRYYGSKTKYGNFKIRGGQGDALVVAIPSISYGILKMVKLGIKRLKAKLWLKLWLKIPKRILYNNKVWPA
jgi:hypothetical protein